MKIEGLNMWYLGRGRQYINPQGILIDEHMGSNHMFLGNFFTGGLFMLVYLIHKKIWLHAIIYCVLSIFIIPVLIYPFYINKIIRKHYLANGWSEAKEMRIVDNRIHETILWDEEAQKYVDGQIDGKPFSEVTIYYKTGEIKQVQEYIINGKLSKATAYYKTGEVNKIHKFVNGKPSKITSYSKTGEVTNIENYKLVSIFAIFAMNLLLALLIMGIYGYLLLLWL